MLKDRNSAGNFTATAVAVLLAVLALTKPAGAQWFITGTSISPSGLIGPSTPVSLTVFIETGGTPGFFSQPSELNIVGYLISVDMFVDWGPADALDYIQGNTSPVCNGFHGQRR